MDLAKLLAPAIAIFLASILALQMYFRQREYELVKQRYLEQGVDVIAAELTNALGVVSHNYARCLQLCKSFRSTGEHFDLKDIDRGFLSLDSSKFQQIAHHRVSSLLKSEIFWEVFQSAMAYAATTNAVITNEIPEAIRLRATTDIISASHEEIAEEIVNDLRKIHDEGFKYAIIVRELHVLGLMLEAERLSIEYISKFHSKKEVKEIIERLQNVFPKNTDQS